MCQCAGSDAVQLPVGSGRQLLQHTAVQHHRLRVAPRERAGLRRLLFHSGTGTFSKELASCDKVNYFL